MNRTLIIIEVEGFNQNIVVRAEELSEDTIRLLMRDIESIVYNVMKAAEEAKRIAKEMS